MPTAAMQCPPSRGGRRRAFVVATCVATMAALLYPVHGDVAQAAATRSSRWAMTGGTARNAGHNPGESRLTPRNVGRLRLDWRRNVGAGGDETPLVVGRRIFTTCGKGGVCARRRATGRVLWHREGDIASRTDVLARPAFIDGVVVATIRRHPLHLGGIDPRTGRLLWRRRFPDASQTTNWPTAHEETIYVGASDGYLHALDSTTGARRWRAESQFASVPAVGGGYVFVNGGRQGSGPYLQVYDRRTGADAWVADGGSAVGSPVIVRGRVVIRTPDGHLLAWGVKGCGRRICRPVWSVDAGVGEYGLHTLSAGPRNLFLDSSDGRLVVIDAETGRRKWESDRGVANLGPPTVANGVAYVADGLYVQAFRAAGCGRRVCQPLWQRRLSEYSFSRRSRVVVAYGAVFVLDHDNRLQRFALP